MKLDATGVPKSSLQSIIESSNELVNNIVDNILNFMNETDLGENVQLRQYLQKKKKFVQGDGDELQS